MNMTALAERIITAVKGYVGDAFTDKNPAWKAFEARLTALEARQKAFRYRGTWRSDEQYDEGNFVTHAGSIWHCKHATHGKPGDSDAWQLAVKRGADGRDAR